MIDRPSKVDRLNKAAHYIWQESGTHLATILDEDEPLLIKVLDKVDDSRQIELHVEIGPDDRFDLWLRLMQIDMKRFAQRGYAAEVEHEVPIAKSLLDTPTLKDVIKSFLESYDKTDRLFLLDSDRRSKLPAKPKPFNVEVTVRVMAQDAAEAWTIVDADLRHYLTESGSGLDWQVTEDGVTELGFIDQPVAPKVTTESVNDPEDKSYAYPDIRAAVEYGIKADLETDENDEYFVRIPEDQSSLIAVYGPDQTPLAGLDLQDDRVDLGAWEGDEWVTVASVSLDGSVIRVK